MAKAAAPNTDYTYGYATKEDFYSHYGWTPGTPVNTSHTEDEHMAQGAASDFTEEERIASRATCRACRIIFTEWGTWAAEGGRAPSATERAYDVQDGNGRQGTGRGTRRASATKRDEVPATDAQKRFVRKLLAEKDLTGSLYDTPIWTTGVEIDGVVGYGWDYMTKSGASTTIDDLLALPRKQAERKAPAAAPAAEVTEGIYRTAAGKVFKVQKAVHGSGNLYAKELIDGSFEYAPGAIRKLRVEDKMTLAEAQEYGRLYGVCIVCGRTLTDESSIEAGIGPICVKKF